MTRLSNSSIREINTIFKIEGDVCLDQNGLPIAKDSYLAPIDIPEDEEPPRAAAISISPGLLPALEIDRTTRLIKSSYEKNLPIHNRLFDISIEGYENEPMTLYNSIFNLLLTEESATEDKSHETDLPINIVALDDKLRAEGISSETQRKLYQIYGEALKNRRRGGRSPIASLEKDMYYKE